MSQRPKKLSRYAVLITGIVYVSLFLHNGTGERASTQQFLSGTTLALIWNQRAAAIASDSFTHNNAGSLLNTSQRKAFQIRNQLIIGLSGPVGEYDGGKQLFDLNQNVSIQAGKLSWTEVDGDATKLKDAAENELAKIEGRVFKGSIPISQVPTLHVFLAGCNKERIFVRHIRFIGKYVEALGGHRIFYAPGEIGIPKPTDEGKALYLLSILDESLRGEIIEMIAGKTQVPKQYRAISRFTKAQMQSRSGIFPMNDLKSAASDIVKLTIQRDSRIGGAVQVVGINCPKPQTSYKGKSRGNR